MENLYEILQVSKNASKEVIEKSYKTLAKKYHPDIAKNKEKAEEMMKKINNAYDILGDEDKRLEYDAQLNSENHNNRPTNNVQQDQNINNNYYSRNTNYTYQNNNIYDRYNYDNYYDYINNPDIFNRLFRLNSTSRKVLIIVILLMILLLIKLVFDIYNFFKIEVKDNISINKPINSSTSASQYVEPERFVENEELLYVFTDFMNDIKEFKIEKLNTYISKEYKIKDNELYNIEKNQKIINNIIKNMQIEIYNSQSSNLNNGKIDIEVKRVDLDLVLLNVSKDIFSNYGQEYTNEKINNMIANGIIENKQNTTKVKTTINFTKEDGKWKINITSNNFYNIFGFNIKQQF